jgi:hypothetical protein
MIAAGCKSCYDLFGANFGHREEAFVCRFVLAVSRLARPQSFNQEISTISAKAGQKGAHLSSELQSHLRCVGRMALA